MDPKRPKSTYSDKLKDPRWQKLRLQVFERDRWGCRRCRDKRSPLHLHHKYYLKGNEPWEYPLEAFLTLCERCHTNEYEERGAAEQMLLHALKRLGFLTDDIHILAEAFLELELRHVPAVVASAYAFAIKTPAVQAELITRHFEDPDSLD
jgi:hypothetical protein